MEYKPEPSGVFDTAAQREQRQKRDAAMKELCGAISGESFSESKNNVCILLRDAWRILDDGPDDSDKDRANAKLGEAMALARIVCKETGL